METMILQKVYRDLSPTDAATRAIREAREEGYRVLHFVSIPQQTLFDGKDDAYVELSVESNRSTK